METNKKFTIIGIGNAGSQVANLAERKYGEYFNTVYINTSDADLSMVKTETSLKFKIGDKKEIEGSGKNRAKMKQFLKDDIKDILSNEDLQDIILDSKYCFIISSTAGGTGSGASPVFLEIMRQMFPDTTFILISILPQLSASLMEQGNTLEFLNELYDTLGDKTTYMIYDNESTADLPPTQALEVVNENIVEDLKILTGVDNYATPYESIDEADMEAIITTSGRLMITRITKGLTEKNMEDSNLDDIIIKTIKKSCHAETNRDKRVIRWGVITYFTDAVNRLYTNQLEGVGKFLGTPVERFNHNAINEGSEYLNFLYLISSGLSPINDRVKKITDRIEELKALLATDDTAKFIMSGDGASYDVLAARRKEERRTNQVSEVSPDDIFKRFMHK